MVSIDLIFALVFYGLILIIFFKTKKKWDIQGGILALYRTKIGLSFMDKFAKKDSKKNIKIAGLILSLIGLILTIFGSTATKPYLIGIGLIILIIGLIIYLPFKWLGNIGIAIGFIGMIFIFFILLKSSFTLFLVEDAQPTVAPVLPGVSIPGLPILSFWHWIISIFVLAIVHEYAHGIFSRAHKIKVKSSGVGFLGPILLAFVEPNEKQVEKASKNAKLSIFAAGPFANILLGLIALISLFFILGPVSNLILDFDGISVARITPDSPMDKTGIEAPFTITTINGIETLSIEEFAEETKDLKPNQQMTLGIDKGKTSIITAAHPDNSSKGFIGIEGLTQKSITKENINGFVGTAFKWISLLIMWTFFINVGVGLFNLLPLGPLDGGKMFQVVTLKIFKNERKAKKVWLFVMYLILLLIFINFIPWLTKLAGFIIKLFT